MVTVFSPGMHPVNESKMNLAAISVIHWCVALTHNWAVRVYNEFYNISALINKRIVEHALNIILAGVIVFAHRDSPVQAIINWMTQCKYTLVNKMIQCQGYLRSSCTRCITPILAILVKGSICANVVPDDWSISLPDSYYFSWLRIYYLHVHFNAALLIVIYPYLNMPPGYTDVMFIEM